MQQQLRVRGSAAGPRCPPPSVVTRIAAETHAVDAEIAGFSVRPTAGFLSSFMQRIAR